MVTASLIKKEGDISFVLPANVAQEEMVVLPVEVLIEITSDGVVELEGLRFQQADRDLKKFGDSGDGIASDRAVSAESVFVNIMPHQDARHWRIIDVMDACAAAGVESLSFSKAL